MHRTFGRLTLPIVAAGALLAVTPADAARYFVTASVFDGTELVEQTQLRCQPFNDDCTGGAPGSLAALALGQGAMQGSAQASSQQLLRAVATGHWQGQPPGGPPGAGATAEIEDRFMLVDPTGTHTEGRLVLHVQLLGSLDEVRGSAHFQARAALCELVFTGSYGCLEIHRAGSVDNGVVTGDPPSGFLSSGVGLQPFNTMLRLSWSLAAGCGYQLDFGSCSAYFGQSAYWRGITVLDGNGQPIAGLRLVSESGVDWLAPSPVPAPASAWLMLCGLAALAACARRRPAARARAASGAG